MVTLKEVELGALVGETCHKDGVGEPTIPQVEEQVFGYGGIAPVPTARVAGWERQAQAHVPLSGPEAQRLEGCHRPKVLSPKRSEQIAQSLLAEHGTSQHRPYIASGLARSTLRHRPVLRDDSGVITFIHDHVAINLGQNLRIDAMQHNR